MDILNHVIFYTTICLALVGRAVQQSAPYDDYSWVQRMGIVGDSYTAGIGAGRPVSGGESCSRYSGSWATMLTPLFPDLSARNIFNFACSGAKTPDISQQIQQLPGNLDLAVLTAGGNDLCLSPLLVACILSPWATDSGCQEMITLAQFGLRSYFEENVRTLLEELLPKMKPSGIIVLGGYGQFFDDTTDACTSENWAYASASGTSSLPLSKSLRATMNSLVRQANTKLASAARVMDNASRNIRVGFADWDDWVPAVHGRFCTQGMDTDPANTPTLHFIKRNTRRLRIGRIDDELRRRYPNDYEDPDLAFNMLARRSAEDFLSSFVANATRMNSNGVRDKGLRARAITTPNCPSGLPIVGDLISIPDFLGSLFHPTPLGHQTIMTFVLNEIRSLRAAQLAIPGPDCSEDRPDCVGLPDSPVPYTSYQAVDTQLSGFCEEASKIIQRGVGDRPFSLVREYHRTSPDQVRISLFFDPIIGWPRTGDFDVNECIDTFQSLNQRCVSGHNPSSNPMRFLTGGSQRISLWDYEITPLRSDRIWPIPTIPSVEVKGDLYASNNAVSYEIRGAGFATWDHGQSTLRRHFAYCERREPIQWDFTYLYPQEDGYEWKAFIQSTAADHTDCMTTGEVIRNAGGPARSTVEWASNAIDWDSLCPDVDDIGNLTCWNDCCRIFIPCGTWCNHYCRGINQVCT